MVNVTPLQKLGVSLVTKLLSDIRNILCLYPVFYDTLKDKKMKFVEIQILSLLKGLTAYNKKENKDNKNFLFESCDHITYWLRVPTGPI